MQRGDRRPNSGPPHTGGPFVLSGRAGCMGRDGAERHVGTRGASPARQLRWPRAIASAHRNAGERGKPWPSTSAPSIRRRRSSWRSGAGYRARTVSSVPPLCSRTEASRKVRPKRAATSRQAGCFDSGSQLRSFEHRSEIAAGVGHQSIRSFPTRGSGAPRKRTLPHRARPCRFPRRCSVPARVPAEMPPRHCRPQSRSRHPRNR